jgi:bifunctional non-homologous end joining protein LigD
MNPSDKRLAIRTEDHPLEYADFEGVIPEGQYGAGPVMVWDKGTYEPEGDIPPDKQLARGKIDVVLQGEKLRGGFTLIQTGRRLAGPSDRKRSLLIKHRDEFADPSWDIDSPELDRSVLTGRTLKEIEEGRPGKKALTRMASKQARQQAPRQRINSSRGTT